MPLKLPSRLALSRHGIYYFRLQFQLDSKRRERRISLSTNNPQIAKAKAIQISAMMLEYNNLDANMPPIDPNDPSTWGALNSGNIQKFDFELPGGAKILPALGLTVTDAAKQLGVIHASPF
jgi:hypothetical protein